MTTYVIGHKNPDTDSVVSAIAYCAIKKQLNEPEDFVPLVAGDLNKETKFVLDKFGFEVPKIAQGIKDDVILVDHNEESQISDEIDKEKIVAVFDHHKLNVVTTEAPITVIMEPVGSTSTVIAKQTFMHNLAIGPKEAKILIAGIVSDTLNLTSPTTTDSDKEILSDLNKIAKINIDELADEMFEAKSDISDINTAELLEKDFKVFDMKNKKVGIGVWETVLPEKVMERKEEIQKQLSEKKRKEHLDLMFFAVVSILEKSAKLFVVDREEVVVAKKAFGGKEEAGLLNLPGVVSRKKQLVPEIEKSI